MNIIIIDDEPLARALLKEYLAPHTDICIIGECANGFEGVKAISELKPDAVFLDVQMPKLNGFEMLELIDSAPAVIFTTAFDEYAIQAFDANAVDYLLKPFTEERLHNALIRLRDSFALKAKGVASLEPLIKELPSISSFQNPRVVVKDKHQIHIIPFGDILYIEAADDYVKIHTEARYYLKKKTMSFFEDALPLDEFCRVHRGYIVRLRYIAKVEPWEKDGAIITLQSKVEVPVSKAGYTRLKHVLGI
jgi:two-component system, LytTR family, response regulator